MDHTYFADSSNLPRTNNKSKLDKICIVPQCGNRSNGDRNITLHRFPKDINILMKWVFLFKLGKRPKCAYACSDHFCSDDFISSKSKRSLKPEAIPSRNLPIYSAEALRKQVQKENRREWSHRKQLFYQKILTRPVEQAVNIPEIVVLEEEPNLPSKKAEAPIVKEKDVPVQVETVIPRLTEADRPKIMSLIRSDAHMQTCTNLTIKQFLSICEMVEHFLDRIPEIGSDELNISSKILLTLMKLKENHSFSHLSFLFDVAVASCSSTFYEMIGILRKVLCQFITWPSKEEIRRQLPKELNNWPQTRVVIDCVEIEVSCSSRLSSDLKNKSTIKFLVGMAPSGPVTFLSRVYDGQAPSKTILDECGLLNLCEPGDTIIANRGFLVDEPCLPASNPPQPSVLVEQSQSSNEKVGDIKPVVAKTKSTVTNTRLVTTNTKPLPEYVRPIATGTKPLPRNTRSVLGSINPKATSTKPFPGNTRPVPRSIKPEPINTKALPANPGSVGVNARPVLKNTTPVVHSARFSPANRERVARPKVHIKTVERIKAYGIINSPITSEIFDAIDQILSVICALINFTPMVKDK